MTTLYLVRHGHKAGEAFKSGDVPLSEKGEKEAGKTAIFFKDKNISAIYASPLLRAKQTAEIIGKGVRKEVMLDARLVERINWEEEILPSFQEFLLEWEKTDRDRSYNPIIGDSSFTTGNRMQSILEEITKNYPNQSVIVVSHGGAIGDLLRNIFGEEELVFVENKEKGVKYLDILTCSITTLHHDGENYLLETYSDTSHL